MSQKNVESISTVLLVLVWYIFFASLMNNTVGKLCDFDKESEGQSWILQKKKMK
jgi:hypothetical protein